MSGSVFQCIVTRVLHFTLQPLADHIATYDELCSLDAKLLNFLMHVIHNNDIG